MAASASKSKSKKSPVKNNIKNKNLKSPAKAKPASTKKNQIAAKVPAKKPVTKPAIKAVVKPAVKAEAPKAVAKPIKEAANSNEFKAGDKVVYPTHGVGNVTGLETQAVGGMEIKVIVVVFQKDKMTLRIPLNRAAASGLRKLSTQDELERVRLTLRSRAKVSKGMWSRRAKEYESKINSGNIVSVAEVVRDLHKNVDDPDRSYSERVIYENALSRLAGEFAAVENMDTDQAANKLINSIKAKAA